MREEVISSGGTNTVDAWLIARSSSPPTTPAASSAGASSPAVPANVGSIDWFGQGQGFKAGSLSCGGSQPYKTSLSTSTGGSALGSSQPSCRPWERGDLLKPHLTLHTGLESQRFELHIAVASSLTCARRGWVNEDVDEIVCESCGAKLSFVLSASWTSAEVDSAGEAFAKQLDLGHKVSCPWKGNNCAESLVQFPPTPQSALIGGYKDQCDGLLQFQSLPVISGSAIEEMRISRSSQVDRFLSGPLSIVVATSTIETQSSREEVPAVYSHSQKLISLCGWETRWLPNVQDLEEHSAQLARNESSFDAWFSKNATSASAKKETGKKKASALESRCESLLSMLDCSLCGATVKIWDFRTVPRPSRLGSNNIDTPEISKKMSLARGASAASGISGWVADGLEKEQIEVRDEAATNEVKSPSNAGVDLNISMAGVLPTSSQSAVVPVTEHNQDGAAIGRDLRIGQPSGSEVGDRATSYESCGPSTRKRSLEGGGSTVGRPPHLRTQQVDSVEGTVIDRDGDEVNDGRQYLAGLSKCVRDFDFDTYHSPYRRDSSGAGPSHLIGFGVEMDVNRSERFNQRHDQVVGISSARDSAHASSVIAMDTIGHGTDEDSMESVENYPGDVDNAHFSSPAMYKNLDMNDASELNYSNQAQQSTCVQPAAERIAQEIGVSSINDSEEILNAETATVHARDRFNFGLSVGIVGMGGSHEAETATVHALLLVTAEPVAEVAENQGQTGEYTPDPGLMDEFIPDLMDREDPYGDSQDVISQSIGREDSGSKIDGSAKADSVESGQKISQSHRLIHGNSAHHSLSCDAAVYSAYEASKGEVTQAGKASLTDGCAFTEYIGADGIGPPNGESNYEEAISFDPIKYHNRCCPWVNENVAAAGSSTSGISSSSFGTPGLCGWQLTLDALEAFQSLGHIPNQTPPSESVASQYKKILWL
ncbi:hypothetical protein MKW92_052306 [Papaver armeniacum]|nr:hypothetical protein MKW92_052306 [Papaver armeniacum]